MRASLVTSPVVDALTGQVASLGTYISTSIAPNLITTGMSVPTAEQRGNAWAKLRADGTLDGVFSWVETSTNWYTPLAWALGTVALFPESANPAGWSLASASTTYAVNGLPSLSASPKYVWRVFDGNGFTIIGGIAYRRYDQAL